MDVWQTIVSFPFKFRPIFRGELAISLGESIAFLGGMFLWHNFQVKGDRGGFYGLGSWGFHAPKIPRQQGGFLEDQMPCGECHFHRNCCKTWNIIRGWF